MNTKTEKSPGGKWQPKTEAHEGKSHILLAEDDLEMRKMLAWSLLKEGFDVTECKDGNGLMKRVGFLDPSREPDIFDLIISDIRMPGVTGMQVLEGTREDENFPPMILITAFGDEDTHVRAKKLGVTRIIDKPFNIEDLLATIAQIIPFKTRSTDIQPLSSREMMPMVQFPLDIIFRHDCGSDPAREFILEQAGRLNRFNPFIQRCHVMIDQSNHEKQKRHRYLVTATVSCTGKTMVARHNSGKDNGHDNLYLTIQIAFDKLYRQVKNYHKKINSNKSHPSFPKGEQT